MARRHAEVAGIGLARKVQHLRQGEGPALGSILISFVYRFIGESMGREENIRQGSWWPEQDNNSHMIGNLDTFHSTLKRRLSTRRESQQKHEQCSASLPAHRIHSSSSPAAFMTAAKLFLI